MGLASCAFVNAFSLPIPHMDVCAAVPRYRTLLHIFWFTFALFVLDGVNGLSADLLLPLRLLLTWTLVVYSVRPVGCGGLRCFDVHTLVHGSHGSPPVAGPLVGCLRLRLPGGRWDFCTTVASVYPHLLFTPLLRYLLLLMTVLYPFFAVYAFISPLTTILHILLTTLTHALRYGLGLLRWFDFAVYVVAVLPSPWLFYRWHYCLVGHFVACPAPGCSTLRTTLYPHLRFLPLFLCCQFAYLPLWTGLRGTFLFSWFGRMVPFRFLSSHVLVTFCRLPNVPLVNVQPAYFQHVRLDGRACLYARSCHRFFFTRLHTHHRHCHFPQFYRTTSLPRTAPGAHVSALSHHCRWVLLFVHYLHGSLRFVCSSSLRLLYYGGGSATPHHCCCGLFPFRYGLFTRFGSRTRLVHHALVAVLTTYAHLRVAAVLWLRLWVRRVISRSCCIHHALVDNHCGSYTTPLHYCDVFWAKHVGWFVRLPWLPTIHSFLRPVHLPF
jgi:hypothetical protein